MFKVLSTIIGSFQESRKSRNNQYRICVVDSLLIFILNFSCIKIAMSHEKDIISKRNKIL